MKYSVYHNHMKTFQVNPGNAGKRLDVFLKKKLPDISRTHIIKNIRKGYIVVNNNAAKPSSLLRENDQITVDVHFSETEAGVLLPNPNIHIPVIFENEHFLVLDKPAGIQVHPSDAERENTIANWIAADYPDILGIGENSLRPGIVHRLDKDTSGLLLIAKTQEAFEALKERFANRKVQKTYLAIVHGKPKEKTGIIDLPIARSKTFRKQTIVRPGVLHKGQAREALTRYQVIKTFSCKLSTVNCSLVSVRPRTGRMHQIRIHLSAIGHPIVGDALYARREYQNAAAAPRQLLHAHMLDFTLFDTPYTFTSPMPQDFEDFLKRPR